MSHGRPLWYKDAVFYELRVRSFYDSDRDGFGDLKGLTEKLDYLQDLGVTTLWLLPFYPSPLRDDGYDTADYMTVHPETGTLQDFKLFLKEAHRRNLSVVTELVLNHTSDQHPWFQRARRAPPGSRHRDFYVWSNDPTRYGDARIIFQDFETSNWTWDPVAGAYYWHRFYSHQPDLNFDSRDVQKALLQVVDHWFELGVDGLRLDAVPYLYEREGTNCENLQETHSFLKKLRAHVDRKFDNRMLLAEANQWPEDAAAYFGNGDECHMAFHFPIMPRMFMALHMEDSFPLLDILEQTPEIPPDCQWAIFLRNHDELTLEMVTDEERDYMVRAYARDVKARINLGIRRRLAPLLTNHRRRIELMNALLCSMPGTPVIYYGDEIGMGDNVYLGDRDGVRTPMQWSPDRNAGFSRANPQQLILPPILDPEYHYEAVNVETQQGNPSSLLWWMKRVIALRKEFRAFGRGSLQALHPSNRKILSFIRRYEEEVILIVANLSRFTQFVELDLSDYRGWRPLELFGHTDFPVIGDRAYLLTLGPHDFYWFQLQAPGGVVTQPLGAAPAVTPTLDVKGGWEEVLTSQYSAAFSRALTRFVQGRRWFRSKSRRIKDMQVADAIALEKSTLAIRLVILDVAFSEGEPETYFLPIQFVPKVEHVEDAICFLHVRAGTGTLDGVLVEASQEAKVAQVLMELVCKKRRLRGSATELIGVPERGLKQVCHELQGNALTRPLGLEQTNTSYLFGDHLVGKLLRRIEEGDSVELEMLRHVTAQGFPHVPTLRGHLKLRWGRGTKSATLGVFQDFVQNHGDAWQLTVDAVQRFFEDVLTHREQFAESLSWAPRLMELPDELHRADSERLIGGFMAEARLLGQRTAELHLVLARGDRESGFGVESYGALAKRAFYQALRNLGSRALDDLKAAVGSLEGATEAYARAVLRKERAIRSRFRPILEKPVGGKRLRCHGDLHLGQVLRVGGDFSIIDFEGEPARSPADRRRKRSPLADVAGMLRSFHYAVQGVITAALPGTRTRREDVPVLEPWSEFWYAWVSHAYLGGYLGTSGISELLPHGSDELATLIDVHLLEKGLYELSYELNNRPTWVNIPLRGILNVVGTEPAE